jgi:hypothetical protein
MPRPAPSLAAAATALTLWLLPTAASAQNFVAVTDSTNPILQVTAAGTYTGAAWVDVDDDGLQDLFIVRRRPIFRNLGGGNFEVVSGVINGQGQQLAPTWSDYDNDGDIDLFMSGNPVGATGKGSVLHRNDGGWNFTPITTGDIGDLVNNGGWSAAWGDFDNDSYTDLIVAAANGFGGVSWPNRLFHNNQDGTFTSIDTTAVTDSLDAHTVATWSDYDDDGDTDLFIGSGEVSALTPDNLFRNMTQELGGGDWGFERITTAPIATDDVDGQVWNWIDYDNDGDLDGYLTNYTFAKTNDLYRNDGGTYLAMTSTDVGDIVNTPSAALANIWGDFDNDGDLDCFITNDGPAQNHLWVNNGDGTFTQDITSPAVTENGPHYGVCYADYDNDGDLDLYVHGNTATKRLFRNDLANGNGYLNVKLVGGGAGLSNVSALGAKVKVKATIGGNAVWQRREVSAMNSFNAMNMLNLHFGLGDATVVDSLVVEWPAGGVETYTNVSVNLFLTLREGVDPTDAAAVLTQSKISWLRQNSPNPFRPSTSIGFGIPSAGNVSLKIFDTAGRHVRTLVDGPRTAGRYAEPWDGRDSTGRPVAAGVYLYRLQAAGEGGRSVDETRKMTLLK